MLANERSSSLAHQVLLDAGRLTQDALSRARGLAAESDESLALTLSRLGLISEQDVADTLSQALKLEQAYAADLLQAELPDTGLGAAFLRQFHVLPLGLDADGHLLLAMVDPSDDYAAHAIELRAGRPVRRRVALPTDLDAALDRLLPPATLPPGPGEDGAEAQAGSAGSTELERLREAASDAPVIRTVNQLLARAVDERASDLHFEPTPDGLDMRLRVDGRLRRLPHAPAHMRDAVVSRIKLMAGLDIAERRLPQDGRLAVAVRGMDVDFRVATAPTQHGESVVVRVLDRAQTKLAFADLGFDAVALATLRPLLAQPHGMLLVTGPTGSGKTTTLYAALSELNTAERKVMTVEDPVEYQIAGVQQVQVQPAIGLTFARALRSFLRHNPNVVMVGEIRDQETADVAVQVALTGHLVLSTLHTNDAASGVTRLLDMGVEDYLLVSTCNAIMAQRLVRTLCLQCREPYAPSPEMVVRLGLDGDRPALLHRAVGCAACGGSGYKGRTTIIEILPLSEPIRALVLRRASASEIGRLAVAEGMRTMHMHGMQKALAGLTTVDEVLSATRDVA